MLDIALGMVIAVGLVGIVVPMLPGSALVLAAILVWAVLAAEAGSWVVFAVAATLIVTGTVVKYLLPGKQLKDAGIPARSILSGSVLGIVGFFVVPVVGLPLGFVLGVYLAEWHRLGSNAWPATVRALRAVGLSILIEFGFAFLATLVWVTGVVLT